MNVKSSSKRLRGRRPMAKCLREHLPCTSNRRRAGGTETELLWNRGEYDYTHFNRQNNLLTVCTR